MRKNFPVTNNEYILQENQTPVSQTDLQGRITFVNVDFCEISGFSEAELIGQPQNIIRHPDMPAEAFEDMWRELKKGGHWTGLVKNRCKNGDFYWVVANVSPVFTNGQITGYASVRVKPERDMVHRSEDIYRQIREKKGNLKIVNGQAVKKGLWGLVQGATRPTIRNKLACLSILSSLSILTVGALGWNCIGQLNHEIEASYKKESLLINRLSSMGMQQSANEANTFYLLSLPGATTPSDKERLQQMVGKLNAQLAQMDLAWQEYSKMDDDQAFIGAFQDRHNHLKGQLSLLSTTIPNQAGQALSLSEKEILREQFLESRKLLDNKMAAIQKTSYQSLEGIRKYSTHIATLMVLATLGCVILLFVVSLKIGQSILQPVNRSIEVAKQIAVGYLANQIDVKASDEISQLMNAMKAMQKSLLSVANSVLANSCEIKAETVSLQGENNHLAYRTQKQSDDIHAASADMEEIYHAAQQNSASAHSVSLLAKQTSKDVNRGQQAIAQVADTVEEIVHTSNKIKAITQLINEITFQTHLLAINASVEAAHAGDKGMGFCVVATELRTLSYRCADAAKEINDIIGQSVVKAQYGLTQVEQAKKIIDASLNSVGLVEVAMNDISNYSKQQATSIEHVSRLIQEIEQTTVDNTAMTQKATASTKELTNKVTNLIRSANVLRVK